MENHFAEGDFVYDASERRPHKRIVKRNERGELKAFYIDPLAWSDTGIDIMPHVLPWPEDGQPAITARRDRIVAAGKNILDAIDRAFDEANLDDDDLASLQSVPCDLWRTGDVYNNDGWTIRTTAHREGERRRRNK